MSEHINDSTAGTQMQRKRARPPPEWMITSAVTTGPTELAANWKTVRQNKSRRGGVTDRDGQNEVLFPLSVSAGEPGSRQRTNEVDRTDMTRSSSQRVTRRISQLDGHVPTMDKTDWQCVEIEAKYGGVSPATARAVIDQADELLDQPDVTVDEIKPVARALLAMLKRHVPPAPALALIGGRALARKANC